MRTLIERASRWLVNNRRPPIDSEGTVEHFGTDIQKVMHALPEILTGVQAEEFESRCKALRGSGVEEDLARAIAVLPPAYAVLEVVEISKRDGIDALEVARVHSVLAERLGLAELMAMIYDLPRDDRWQTMARASLRDDLHAVHALLDRAGARLDRRGLGRGGQGVGVGGPATPSWSAGRSRRWGTSRLEHDSDLGPHARPWACASSAITCSSVRGSWPAPRGKLADGAFVAGVRGVP